MNDDYKPLPLPNKNAHELEAILDQAPHRSSRVKITYHFCNNHIHIPTAVALTEERIAALFNILHMIGYAQQAVMCAEKEFKQQANQLALEHGSFADYLLSNSRDLTTAEAINHALVIRYLGRKPH